jgi:glycosyltransferase involved in cell wall biosynthesis
MVPHMKILMVSDMYPPAIGGMEREIQLLAEGLVKEKNCEVSICTIRSNSSPTFEKKNRVKVYRMEGFFQKMPFLYNDLQRKYHPPTADWVVTRKIARIIQKEKPDIIHAHNWMLYSVSPLKKKFEFALCATFHDFGFICPCRWSTLHVTGICNSPLTGKCIVCARVQETYGLIKSVFAYLGVKSQKDFPSDIIIFSNPNIVGKMNHLKQRKVYLEHPIETKSYKSIRVKTHRNRILCWAKLQKIKGIDTIFRVAEKLDGYQFDIPFVGDDKEYYKAVKPRNVRLIPRLESHEITRTINSYPIVLGQFHIGAFGLAELEVMSSGKPVVAYWDRQYDRFYDEPCPILSSKNVAEIVDLVKSNIGNEELGRANRQWILKYHAVSKVVEKLFKIYKETLAHL